MKNLVRKLKGLWILLNGALATIFVSIPILSSSFLSRTGNLPFIFEQFWCMWALVIAGVRLEVKGRENIDSAKSYVIISNHQSHYDIPALMYGLGVQFRWVIKKELRRVPLWGLCLYASRHVFVDRSNMKKAIESIRHGVSRLPTGASLMVFAEGTRSGSSKVRKFRRGGFEIAIQEKMPILPVTINGSWKIMPDRNSMDFYSGPIEVIVGSPISTEEYSRENIRDLVEKTRDSIISRINSEYPG